MRASVAGSMSPLLRALGQFCGCTAFSAAAAPSVTAEVDDGGTDTRNAQPQPPACMDHEPDLRCLPQEVAIPRATLFQAALLGGEVDVHQAKTARVPFRPFEVVHQCPGEIAFDGHAPGARLMHRQKMALKIVAPLRVRDRAIRCRPILIAGAVFRDVDFRRPVFQMKSLEQRAQALR